MLVMVQYYINLYYFGNFIEDNNIHATNIGICSYNKYKSGFIESADTLAPMYLRKSQAERMKDLK